MIQELSWINKFVNKGSNKCTSPNTINMFCHVIMQNMSQKCTYQGHTTISPQNTKAISSRKPKTVGQSLVCTNHKCVSECIRANELHNPGGIVNSVIQAEGPGIVQYTTCAAVYGGPGIRHLIKPDSSSWPFKECM